VLVDGIGIVARPLPRPHGQSDPSLQGFWSMTIVPDPKHENAEFSSPRRRRLSAYVVDDNRSEMSCSFQLV
jgi:hypothetical protein